MRISNKMIDKEIRFKGVVFSKLANLSSEKKLRVCAKLSKKVVGNKDKTLVYEEKFIVTKNDRVRVCIYKNLNAKPNATGLLWFHGGGYAIGTPEKDIEFYKNFLRTANCVIVSPDYTLSVDKPYPAALNDCYDTLCWMKENAEKLGIRSDQIFIGGESAGGGLAIATTLYARDKGDVNIAFQIPLYPMIDDRMNTPSAIDNNAPIWNSNSNYLGWKLYLGDFFETENVPKYAAPAREVDFSNLPPAFTFIGDLDPFYDETKIYVDNLKNAGIKVEFHEYKGCYHGFNAACPNAQCSKNATSYLLKAFKYATENYFKEQSYMNKIIM